MARAYFNGIEPGAVVTYRTPQGQTGTVRAARLLCFDTHIVGARRSGSPVVVNATNYVAHRNPAAKVPA